MADDRRRPPADPEFASSAVRPAGPLEFFDPSFDQRVVVNPFLAVLGLVGLAWLAKGLVASKWPLTVGLLFLPLILLPNLIQFHCLDCGRTEPYPRIKRHICPMVLARRHDRENLNFPLPRGTVQLMFWGWVLGAIGLLLAITTWT